MQRTTNWPWKKSSGRFPRMKTCGFRGCRAPGIASLRSSRLFIHSLFTLAQQERFVREHHV
jgi:hypothetical protein